MAKPKGLVHKQTCPEHTKYQAGCEPCRVKFREWAREYYKANHEKVLAGARRRRHKYWREKPEVMNARHRQYVATHRERVKEQQRESYYRHHESRKARLHANYQKNGAKYRETANRVNQRLRVAALQKLGGECVRCDVTDPRFLQFNHIHGGGRKHYETIHDWSKFYEQILRGDLGKETFDVRCANHNRLYEYEVGRRVWVLPTTVEEAMRIQRTIENQDQFWHQQLHVRALAYLGGKCVKCGVDDPRILEVNHTKGNGRQQFKKQSANGFYADIVAGRTPKGELDVRCCNDNLFYEYERGYRKWLL